MAIQNAFLRIAHPGRPLASTASIAILLLILSSVVGHSVAVPVHRQMKLSHRPVAEKFEEESKGGHTTEFQNIFEVTKPINTTGEHHVATIPLLTYDFANSNSVAPPNATYVPTKKVLGHNKFNKVVLKWSADCKGVQFDRVSAIWLGGVEIFRTITAEPTLKGVMWEIEKDVTRYSSLWKEPQQVVVALANVVDSNYTGIINVTISVLFYHSGHNLEVEDYFTKPADIIFPIKEASFLNGGYWFQLSNATTDKFNTSLKIPPNTYRAVLEVCLSFHVNDEFWYTNPPNAYIEANNLTGVPGNGAFREVVASIDDKQVAAVYPFVVVYTGGINPLFWRPVVGIGAFDLPSYDFDITPLLGSLLDGENHTYSLNVTDALYLWLLDANLHIWVDPKSESTSGKLVEFSVPPSNPQLVGNFSGLNGTFVTTSSRKISYVGYVESSFGNMTTSSSYSMNFTNTQVLTNDSNVETIDQLTQSESTVIVKSAGIQVALDQVSSSYPFHLFTTAVAVSNDTVLETFELVHALKRDEQATGKKYTFFSYLTNNQTSVGELLFAPNSTSGIAETQQTYSYQSSEGCYERAVTAKNSTVISDTSSTNCSSTTS